MKLLKSTLFMIAIVAIQPVSARPVKGRGAKPAATSNAPVVAPSVGNESSTPEVTPDVSPNQTFQNYLQQVQNMNAANVINNLGVFTDSFKNFVKSSDLAPELMEALLQAGRNLHLPLSGTNNQDLATIDYAQENINRFITQQTAATAPAQVDLTPIFYNSKTNLFRQDYLDKYLSSDASLTGIPQKDAERMVIGDLMPKITDIWKKRNIPMSISQVDAARGQIIRTIEKEFKKWSKPQTGTPRNEWYSQWTQLLTTQYLDKFVGDALRLKKPQRQYENELEEIERQVKSEWEKEGVTSQAKNALAPLLNKQLEETANAIEQKRSLKKGVMNELETKAKKIKAQPQPSRAIVPYQSSAIVPYQSGESTANRIDDAAQGFVTAMIDQKREALENALKLDSKNSYNYATALINDILKQLSRKYPSVTQEQAMRMLAVAINISTVDVLAFIIATVKNYGASVPAPAGKSKAALAIEYKPQNLTKELNPQTDPLTQKLINQSLEKAREQTLQIVPFVKNQPEKKHTAKEYNEYARKLASDVMDDLNNLFILENGEMVLNIASREFNNFTRDLIEGIRSEFPKINKPDMKNALQSAMFIMPNPSTAQIENSYKAALRMDSIIDDIWAQKK